MSAPWPMELLKLVGNVKEFPKPMSPEYTKLILKALAYVLAGGAFFTLTLMGMMPVPQFVSLVKTLIFILVGAHLVGGGTVLPPFVKPPVNPGKE